MQPPILCAPLKWMDIQHSSSPISTLGLFSMLVFMLPQTIFLSMHSSREKHRKSTYLPFFSNFLICMF